MATIFKKLFSSLSTQISLFIQVLGFIFFSRKNFSYFDLLLLFEENKHLSEMFSNELIYIGSSNFFKNTAPNKTICYHFEFPAGRAFISASKNASVSKVISMQHGIISRGKWCYELVGMMARNKHLKHYTPHLYLLEGVFSWWVLNQFIEDSKIRLVGAPRQDSFHSSMLSLAIENKTISHEIDTSSNTVLLMDLHTTDKNLIEHIKTILKEMNELKQIYIRPHPRDTYAIQKVEKVKKIFTNLSFESLNNSFQSDIKKFNSIIFWGESTGALLDCLGYGINIKVLRVKGMLMLDPIIDIEMNLEDINNFIVEKHLLDVSPVSIDNPNEIFKLLFKNSLKTSSVQVLDCLYN